MPAKLTAWWDGEPFDAVLLDAPCSATGIVRRQPDVLLHRRPEDLTALTAVQARAAGCDLADAGAGGVLLYATCSILKDENDARWPRSWPARPTRGSNRWMRDLVGRCRSMDRLLGTSVCRVRMAVMVSSMRDCARA